jgi:hypothetical protein
VLAAARGAIESRLESWRAATPGTLVTPSAR